MARASATRWGLGAGGRVRGSAPVAAATPDIVLDYERSLHPDLILYTDVQDASSAVADLLRLANQLQRRKVP